MRNLPAVVEDSAADRERLKSILRLAQSSGDRYHVTALRLVLKRFDERTRAARHRPRQVSAQLEPKPHHSGKGTRHANA